MRHVVLDANVVILELRAQSPAWQRLRATAQLYLPAVVVDEVRAHRQNRFQPDVARVIRALEPGSDDDLLHGVSVLPYPDVSHAQVVARALARRKPFDADGHDGYRDTLVWETVLALARRVEAVVLATRNTKDFAGEGGGLHADLLADLGATLRVELAAGLPC